MNNSLCAIDAVIELQKPVRERLEQYFRIESVDFKHLDGAALEQYELALVHSKLAADVVSGLKA